MQAISHKFAFFLLVLTMLSACSRQPALLTFSTDLDTAEKQGTEACGRLGQNYASGPLRFYISDLTLRINGHWQAVGLIPSDSQTADVALINLGPNCIGSDGPAQFSLPLAIRHSQFVNADVIRLAIGIPFLTNHKNPLTQPPPLNEPSMFWSWQRGHKFLRWELTNTKTGKPWSFHLGSVGCVSPSAMRPPYRPCSEPNIINIDIQKTSPSGTVMLQTQQLLDNIDLDNSEGCMFRVPEEKDCEPLKNNLQRQWMVWREQ